MKTKVMLALALGCFALAAPQSYADPRGQGGPGAHGGPGGGPGGPGGGGPRGNHGPNMGNGRGGPQPSYDMNRRWARGERYDGPREPRWMVNDWRRQPGLWAPPSGYSWMRYGNQFLLTALATGIIAGVVNAGVGAVTPVVPVTPMVPVAPGYPATQGYPAAGGYATPY
ncbi:RcnB family protein [Acetobacter persici]|uniref:Integral membrane protein n=1 Tax=Acetobacter persici TaxID=1076596 RepID=A0A1U9LDT4_9PROT|nr:MULTISPECIES: RcnB family protein [Acetobacter]AQT04615.1 hypothetical protein A0U91_06265 [Acetobacter persici]MBS1001639.1 RcnB family protein [Acetobacter persici]MCG0997021.1 RcnB family protein [Acetobacter persici]